MIEEFLSRLKSTNTVEAILNDRIERIPKTFEENCVFIALNELGFYFERWGGLRGAHRISISVLVLMEI